MRMYFVATKECGKVRYGKCPIGKCKGCNVQYAQEITGSDTMRAPGPYRKVKNAMIHCEQYIRFYVCNDVKHECGMEKLQLIGENSERINEQKRAEVKAEIEKIEEEIVPELFERIRNLGK